MPTDRHGATHAGSLGLFDDEDEKAATIARVEHHEIEGLEKVIRREERRTKRRLREEDKAAQREGDGRYRHPRPVAWLTRLLSGSKDLGPETETARLLEGEGEGTDEKASAPMSIHVTAEWRVVRAPVKPDEAYTAQDVDPVDSPFLRECGMARVMSGDAGGCHIVPKSRIQKSD